jgi:hypothetical protein
LNGCTNPFLGVEDYQRDVISGLLAAALLGQSLANSGDGTGAPADGRDGADGLNCWDLNGNGAPDAAEDANGDGAFDALDCQGTDGADGDAGSDGADGANGSAGLRCWDLNGNGVADPSEDRNADGFVTVLDCSGQDGSRGSNGGRGSEGPAGLDGQDGPAFFNIFIDDFFGQGPGFFDTLLPIRVVRVDEPVLGGFFGLPAGDISDAVAYRVAIPDTYDAGNDVSMRIYFYRTGSPEGDCFIITVDSVRARNGGQVEAYGSRRWVRIETPHANGVVGNGSPDILLAVDLPINAAAGLDYPDDLADGDFLAFELATYRFDGAAYQMLGVEFVEAPSDSAVVSGATIFPDGKDANCNECQTNEDCDDGDLCTEDACDGICYNHPVCQGPCLDGVCVDCLINDDCDDQIACTIDTCVDGACEIVDKCECMQNADCDDANACTADQCVEFSCSNNVVVICQEGRDCNPVSGCDPPG